MRKPRDIDAELRALAEKAKGLKARKITQLGELVIATGAEGLDPEVLAGMLVAAVEASDAEKGAWRRQGAAFFQRQGKDSRSRGKTANSADRAGSGGAANAGGAQTG